MNSNTKNRDLEITARLPPETMQQAIELSRIARQLARAEWITGWTPPTVSASVRDWNSVL